MSFGIPRQVPGVSSFSLPVFLFLVFSVSQTLVPLMSCIDLYFLCDDL